MSEAQFTSAYESIAEVVEKAAMLPDHRDRQVETPWVRMTSPDGNVSVTVHDGKVESLWLDVLWVQDTSANDLAETITQVINKALERWSQEQLDQVMQITPDMKELAAAINAAKSELDDAWAATLIEAKVKP